MSRRARSHPDNGELGLALLQQAPLAFLSDADRGPTLRMYTPISWHLPLALTLEEAAAEIAHFAHAHGLSS